MTNSVSVIVGVNPGYDAFTIQDPIEAVQCISSKVLSLDIQAKIFPGYVLYPRGRGCPIGGEAIGALFTSHSPAILQKMEMLRIHLNQTTLSVITPPETGISMSGFLVNFGPGNLQQIALLWQEYAAQKYTESPFHVSAAIYEREGEIYGQAEANPTRITDLEAWKRDAQVIINRISESAMPIFREVGYHYLRSN